MPNKCNGFQQACQEHQQELLTNASAQDVARASMTLTETSAHFARWSANRIAIEAQGAASGTPCATCPTLRSVLATAQVIIDETTAQPGKSN